VSETPDQSPPVSARSVAALALVRVLRDGAFAAAALSAELERSLLPERDRALATELLYGTLRVRGALDARLAKLAPRGLKDLLVRAELLVAAYQLLALDRVPPFAAVNSAVNAVRALRGPQVAGFANAILRKLSQSGEKLSADQGVRESVPAWLLSALEASVGEAEALALVVPAREKIVGLRLISGRDVPGWLSETPHGRLSPRARLVQGEGDPRKREGYAEGAFVMQEEGAQAIALSLGARPGERVLDACAGRGQKTSLLAEQVGPSGAVWATDQYPNKLKALETEFERLQLPALETRAVDWTVGGADVPRDFDRVLVDAPCTGTGTLRRRPEIAQRLQPGDPERLSALAESILRAAAEHVRPGGRVVFAVCSVLEAECEALVTRISDALELTPFDAPELAAHFPAETSSFRIGPTRFETDGYFCASFRRA